MLILKAPQSEVLAAVQRVSGVTPSRSPLIVLTNLLLRKDGDVLSLTSSDLDVQATTTASLGGEPGSYATTVSAKRIADVLKAVPSDQVVSLTAKDSKLTLQAGKSRFTMQTLPAEQFPLMNAIDAATEFCMPQKTLLALLDQVAFAMAVHDVRYFLNGAYLHNDGDTMTAVGTDGKRCAKVSATVEAPACSVIIPRGSVLHLVKLLAPVDEPVTVRLTKSLATFAFGGMQFTTKLVEGIYPDYKRLIATKVGNHVTLGRKPLLRALQAVGVMTDDKFRAIRLKFASGSLSLSAATDGTESAEHELEIDYDGPELEIGIEAKQISEGLSSVEDDMVRIEFDADKPVILSLPNGDASFRYVVSPLRI